MPCSTAKEASVDSGKTKEERIARGGCVIRIQSLALHPRPLQLTLKSTSPFLSQSRERDANIVQPRRFEWYFLRARRFERAETLVVSASSCVTLHTLLNVNQTYGLPRNDVFVSGKKNPSYLQRRRLQLFRVRRHLFLSISF